MSYQLSFDLLANVKQEFAQQFQKVKQQIDQAKTSLTQQGQALDTAAQKGIQYAKSHQQIAQAQQKAQSQVKSFSSSMGSMLTGMTAAATGLINLSRSHRDLEDTQIAVVRTTKKLSTAQEAQKLAQQKINELVDDGKKGTPEYEKALEDLKQANLGVEVATLNHGEALEAQKDAYTDFYVSIIPAVMGVLGALGTSMSGITSRLGAVTAGFSQMSVGARALRVAMIGIPLVAIAAAFLAVRNNMFGVRDMLDQLGATIGKIFPQLTPFLNWVKDLATALGLTGQALDLKAAWQLFIDGFKGAVDALIKTDWAKVIQDMITTIANFIRTADWQEVWDNIIEAIHDVVEWTQKNIAPIFETAIEELSKWIEETDWKAVWDSIVKAVHGIIAWSQKNVGPLFEKAITELAKWIKTTDWTTVGNNIRDAIGSSVKWLVENVTPVIQGFVSQAITAVGKVDWAGLGRAIISSIGKAVKTELPTLANDLWNQLVGIFESRNVPSKSGIGGFLEGLFPKIPFAGGQEEGKKGGQAVTLGQQQGDPFASVLPQAISSLDKLKAYANTTTTQISSFFLTMESSIRLTFTRIGTIFTTAFIALPQQAMLQTSQASAAFVTMEASMKGTLLRIGAIFPTTFLQLVTQAQMQTAQASVAFITMETSIKATLLRLAAVFPTAFTTLPTNVGLATSQASVHFITMETSIKGTLLRIAALFPTAFVTLPTNANTATSQTSAHFVTMQSSIQGTMARILNDITSFTTSMAKMPTEASKHTSNTSAAFVTMATSIRGSVNRAISEMNSLISTIKSVGSQAASAEKQVNALAKAINSLKSKSINVHVGLTGPGVKFMAHGFHGVISKPTMMVVGEA